MNEAGFNNAFYYFRHDTEVREKLTMLVTVGTKTDSHSMRSQG